MQAPASNAYERLHPKIQEWIYREGWAKLRVIQEDAITAVLDQAGDVIISAATAQGKTEAAFLPICSLIAEDWAGSVRALYISPLKALINDQFGRLEALCEALEIPVHRWHGDVDASRKKRLIRQPSGILLITPESLEAIFINHGASVCTRLFSRLQFVVADELHGFIGAERGRQLQSLLHRLDTLLGRRVPRIALSATLGDLDMAAEFLRPGHGLAVTRIVAGTDTREVQMQVRGYIVGASQDRTKQANDGGTQAIAEHLFGKLRGSDNLIFANARSNVEDIADRMRRMCEDLGVPNEFWPHHGNLSRELRADVETRLKQRDQPINVVCTSTLELGIDIGCVKSIAQIGVPPSVSSLLQRMGRSGRRDDPQVLRVYIQELEIGPKSPPMDTLREELVQTIAIINLMLRHWCEPPSDRSLHFSTLVQQTLSMLAQYGGATALQLWQVLCATGPFSTVDQPTFGKFLRSLASAELIHQCHDDTLVLGGDGERLVNHYDFYSAFTTPDEYRLFHNGRALGTLPIVYQVVPGTYIIYAGRRWLVLTVDDQHKTIDLQAAAAGVVPQFAGDGIAVDQKIRSEMFDVYQSNVVPAYLDATARQLLSEARASFTRYQLAQRALLRDGEGTLLFHWHGDVPANTLALLLRGRGLKAIQQGIAVGVVKTPPEALRPHLEAIVASDPPEDMSLAAQVPNKVVEKHDRFLTEELLCRGYAARHLDPVTAHALARSVLLRMNA